MRSELIQTARNETSRQLGLDKDALLYEEDMSVFLSFYIEGLLDDANITPREKYLQTARNELLQLLRDNLNIRLFANGLPISNLLDNEYYMERIFKLAFDRFVAGKNSPSLRISPEPTSSSYFSGEINLGLIFGSMPLFFQDTLLSWYIDEARSFTNSSISNNGVTVLAVHYQWLTNDLKASRALIVDERSLVKEVDFFDPVDLDFVHITELPLKNEISLHDKLSRAFSKRNIYLINPYTPSARVDDKYVTYNLLKSHGIDTPHAFLLPRNKSDSDYILEIERILKIIKQKYGSNNVKIFVQPNHGTEGNLVESFDPFESRGFESLLKHIKRIGAGDEALVRVKRGNIRYYKENNGGYRNIVLRINVTWNGNDYKAESGFAQVADHEDNPVASRSRDGCVLNIHDALKNLFYRDEESGSWEKIEINKTNIGRIKNAAVHSAHAINDDLAEDEKLKLLGVDVILEYRKGGITPCILEINPRLAGLNHSLSIDEDECYISWEIFNYLRTGGNMVNNGIHKSKKF